MKLNYFVVICFLIFLPPLWGQQEFIRGKLLDVQTGEPVVFATIRIKGKAVGVISNQDGGFRIPKKFKELGDVLVISSMGYQKKEIPIAGLSSEDINIVRLFQGVLELSEAVVTARKKRRRPSPRRIVRKAIEAIPVNFPQNAFSTIGYYRDYQLNQKNEYINLNEAIIEVFDEGFDELDHKTSQVRIYDYKRNEDFKRYSLAEQRYNYQTQQKVINNAFLPDYGGNEFIILRIHDALRNHKVNSFDFVNVLEQDLLRNHHFFLEEDTYLGNDVLYTIGFRKSLPGHRVYGILYISKQNFAIHGMEYSVYDRLKTNTVKKINKYNTNKQLVFEVITEYKPIEDKMFLNYISFHNSFQLWDAPVFMLRGITVDLSKKCFIVTFSDLPVRKSATNLRNYKFRFEGRKVKFLRGNLRQNVMELYPDMEKSESQLMFKEIENHERRGRLEKEFLDIKISDIKDLEGNVLNKWISRDYQQFREYFVQQINQKTHPIPDSLLMKKDRPIFKDQPIVRPDNFEEYWMNTPLK
ncbi:carboxypeptidase-like regulatory domain-containing protein [Ulvibacterium marinum]|uniref:Carboxypeptidase-like regulatory domain-containing protein n=1 Tax=Ulvibacterium marinum TaxID=2419782 RepID=A0A3B0C852_9FLAO|nr:carboxypeptidase-like regulatory domain-containing protein [Ulvibacterium marinum]RKN79927.1 carboxypeptidase-like regulatory domain-containing protein [Ulvibacterium marinum]